MIRLNKYRGLACFVSLVMMTSGVAQAQKKKSIVPLKKLNDYTTYFNSLDSEDVKNYVSNDKAAGWIAANAPMFDCPDSAIEKVYYYRWWTFRKHLKETPAGFIFTEFITPVKHAGKFNAISSALGHQIYEGRWLRNPTYIDQYVKFWLIKEKALSYQRFHGFSSWIDDAVYNRYLVNQDKKFVGSILDSLSADYRTWEREREAPSGMFWQYDVKDAMEESVSGGRKVMNRRPSINSYMYGNAVAIAKMAALFNNTTLESEYKTKADRLRKLTVDSLWSDSASFFCTKYAANGKLAPREAIGFIPWYFDLPADNAKYAKAWNELVDPDGFNAPMGITTAERREPTFRKRGSGHSCEWDGAIWPFATSQTLKSLANLLTNYSVHGKMNKDIFYTQVSKYAKMHMQNGHTYVGEYHGEKKKNDWLKGVSTRSRFYNHSTFCDIVIADLVGLKPRADNIVEVNPLVPEGKWDYFCLENVAYHGKNITVIWDKTGKKYNKGKGLLLFANGKQIARADTLGKLQGKI